MRFRIQKEVNTLKVRFIEEKSKIEMQYLLINRGFIEEKIEAMSEEIESLNFKFERIKDD